MRNLTVQNWVHWLLNLLAAVGVGVLALPLARSRPEAFHNFALALHPWQRRLFIFILCLLLTYSLFKLFNPRLTHLKHPKHLRHYPPVWLAWLLAAFGLMALDLRFGLSPTGYRATALEWLGYGGGSVALAWIYRWFITPPNRPRKEEHVQEESTGFHGWGRGSLWEEWLRTDAAAKLGLDFLNAQPVAQRIKDRLEGGKRSVGVVGPFGAGKTTIVEWLDGLVENDPPAKRRLLISRHSCWNFESSSSSIHAMLTQAIARVGDDIDTFHVSSLPESYRQTFSSGGKWLDAVTRLVLKQRDPLDQFRRLSDLLGVMKKKLVFVVEDLDRNDSRTFDVQEVQGFLQQLKEYPNLSFVLTGGVSSSNRIDFTKLCDHIEYLKSVDGLVAANAIYQFRDFSWDPRFFKFDMPLTLDVTGNMIDPGRLFSAGLTTRSIFHDIATLLNTPRLLRHALGRTCDSWRDLRGEINWVHLLIVNTLRTAAPECFSFLIRQWSVLKTAPSISPDARDESQREIVNDWRETVEGVEWNPAAAKRLMEYVLPSAETWLAETLPGDDAGSPTHDTPQGIHLEKYWRRAISESVDHNDIRDLDVIRDIVVWLDDPSPDTELVKKLCGSEIYGDTWKDWAERYLRNKVGRHPLLLCEHVLTRIARDHGAKASENSRGFMATLNFAREHANSKRASHINWFRSRIDEASRVSLELVNGLCRHYGAGNPWLLEMEDAYSVGQTEIEALSKRISDAGELEKLLHPTEAGTIYGLIHNLTWCDPTPEGLKPWAWLAPILLDSLRSGNPKTAANVAELVVRLGPNASPRHRRPVNVNLLESFFGVDMTTIVDFLDGSANRITPLRQRAFVKGVVKAVRDQLAKPPADGGSNS